MTVEFNILERAKTQILNVANTYAQRGLAEEDAARKRMWYAAEIQLTSIVSYLHCAQRFTETIEGNLLREDTEGIFCFFSTPSGKPHYVMEIGPDGQGKYTFSNEEHNALNMTAEQSVEFYKDMVVKGETPSMTFTRPSSPSAPLD